ncbi:hypothetical protein [Ruminococcus bicirculans (ex Wegman et al. 2014)]|uniref:hypothetical protein n=1 Tax=Ruminococcus bicirculans (ex Wegman et al. 2014) TaxID=1160721 RepID=UPI00164460B2|nr:hypothetical protein [Ruminococcus bicirculans (ex Wegman et al. 2014)]MBC3514021.1 hypothetical protein [Ruminococcus bicirculans (ex Wegman et al. 2014)]
MTENLQTDGVQSRQVGFVRCWLNKSRRAYSVKTVCPTAFYIGFDRRKLVHWVTRQLA